MEGINEQSFIIRMTPDECLKLKELFKALHRNPSSVGFKTKNLTQDNKEIISKIYNLFEYESDQPINVQDISHAPGEEVTYEESEY